MVEDIPWANTCVEPVGCVTTVDSRGSWLSCLESVEVISRKLGKDVDIGDKGGGDRGRGVLHRKGSNEGAQGGNEQQRGYHYCGMCAMRVCESVDVIGSTSICVMGMYGFAWRRIS